MVNNGFGSSLVVIVGVLAVASAPSCGGKTEDLLAFDVSGATGGASQVLTTGGSVATGGSVWAATGGTPWTATGGRTSGPAFATGGTTAAQASATGGTTAALTTAHNRCAGLTVPFGFGNLSIASGYVTIGSLHGYGYTYVGENSNDATCIVPECGITGCNPAFGATVLCATGVVGMDTDYNSIVGLGFNLNQAQTGDRKSIPAPSTVTVSAVFASTPYDTRRGNASARVQVVDYTGIWYCVDAGTWVSGSPIDISSFNTTCWDNMGEPLRPGTPIVEVDVVVPSEATADRPFEFCITDVAISL